MSHYMTALAMKQKGLKPAAKIVLYWLADHHNESTGACFPSLRVLAEECEMSKRSVQDHLDTLEAAGLIQRRARSRENGSQTSNGYVLNFVTPPVQDLPPPVADFATPPVQILPPLNLGNNNLGKEPSIIHQAFAEFWEMYPRKVGRAAAEKAFAKAAGKARTDDIIFGLSQQRAIMAEKETQFIPHAATWLNQERWNDNVDDLGRPAQTRPAGNRGGHDSLMAGFAQYASRQSE
jgi:hypothetical protein